MSSRFQIESSDPALLDKANRIARKFIQPYRNDHVIGIVFLGAIARGYFDRCADIDIAIFKKDSSPYPALDKFTIVDGIEVQVWLSDYEREKTDPWDMPKRWTYAYGKIEFDPAGRIARLLEEKVPLKPEERKGLMMSGLTLSEWYANRLTRLWVERGSLVSAHRMIDQGLIYFFDMLFGLNNELVPDMKWRYYCAERLERIPRDFSRGVQEVMRLQSCSEDELERRRQAFMALWREMQPVIEAEAGLSFEEMLKIV
jgi:hypothetical protein